MADTIDTRPHLVHEARKAIENRIAKYFDPHNLYYDWDDADRWERHAMNAVLDLQKAEARVAELEKALRDISAAIASNRAGFVAEIIRAALAPKSSEVTK